jgi:hypothetical protein
MLTDGGHTLKQTGEELEQYIDDHIVYKEE